MEDGENDKGFNKINLVKSWLSLISSPNFAKTHPLLSASNKNYSHHGLMFRVNDPNRYLKDCCVNALLYDSVTEALDVDYPCTTPNDYTWIVSSVNGLICLVKEVYDDELHELFLWNPSIRKYKKLPKYRLKVSRAYSMDEIEYFKFCFVYDELQDDYKVVGVFPIHENMRRVEVKIYSLKSDSWRCIDDYQGTDFSYYNNNKGKLVNGKIHWLGSWCKLIISIDLANEKWTEIEKPGCGTSELGVFGSCLSVLNCEYASTRADLWVMKEYGVKESWTKMFTTKSPGDSMLYMFHPPIITSNEGEILLRHGSRFTKYNPKDDSIRYLDVTNFDQCYEAEIYVKSLICPLSQKGP
ncbi:F-box/kelch-repeat protein At3g23880-like [Lycium ferocissimum]|uniref:F-box/kelch-repeat protein At3g23880-like n=1 Tax=Lycium ferocissimum TaxID=112874 RepID=UPI0028166BBC|nr:F-box/kelch-repeat protein At3g23880-like [Lycium ferocissimum]